jgi:hypothetical protein
LNQTRFDVRINGGAALDIQAVAQFFHANPPLVTFEGLRFPFSCQCSCVGLVCITIRGIFQIEHVVTYER